MTNDGDPLGIIGTTVDGKYEIQELAGEGGYSAVYRAQHLVWNEPVAIKFFSLLEDAKPELREQLLNDFIQEGKLMTQLSSRSAAIVQARDIGKLALGDDEWIPYMVLEWLDGYPLDQVLRREMAAGMPPRSLDEAVTLLGPAAEALYIAHQAGVAHRDLKPANIVVMGDPRDPNVSTKVLDFGIAKVMSAHSELQDQLQLTGTQITAFTPNYGAPEQFSRNFGATGPWTDVFAMALIVMELVRGGHRALEGATFFELGVKSCDATTRPTPAALGIEVSADVEAVFAHAMALQPKDRFPSMGEFWSELHAAVFPGGDTWTRGRSLSQSVLRPLSSITGSPSGASLTGPSATGSSATGPSATGSSATGSSATGPHAIIAGNISDEATSEPTEALPSGNPALFGATPTGSPMLGDGVQPAPTDPTQANMVRLAPVSAGSNKPIAIGAAVGAIALVIGTVMWMGKSSSSEPPTGASVPPAPSLSESPSSEPSAAAPPEPDVTASTSAGADADPTAEPDAPDSGTPPPVRPIPRPVAPKPKPTASPKTPPDKGGDPFDPNNFGGR
jgi:eukaryotic-like serine/threonine-protein kinase